MRQTQGYDPRSHEKIPIFCDQIGWGQRAGGSLEMLLEIYSKTSVTTRLAVWAQHLKDSKDTIWIFEGAGEGKSTNIDSPFV